jgi:hypothetical protein
MNANTTAPAHGHTHKQELASLELVLDLPFHAPYNIAEIDFSIVDILVGSSSIALATRSSVNDTRHPTTDPYPVAPPAIPATSPTVLGASMVVLTISPWPINNGFWTFSEAGLLQYPVAAADVPPSFPIQFNTTFFDDVVPGLAKAYPDCLMNLLLTVPAGFTEVAKVVDGQGVAVSNLPLQFNFSVLPNSTAPALPAFSLQCPVGATANASVTTDASKSKEIINLAIASLGCTPLSVVSSEFGNVTVDGLDMLVTTLLTAVVLPDLNKFLAGGFVLPSMDGVTLTALAIDFVGGTMQITSDIAWAPTFVAAAAATTTTEEE